MIISVNDIPEMREIFADMDIQRFEIAYTVGGSSRGKAKTGELVITNFAR